MTDAPKKTAPLSPDLPVVVRTFRPGDETAILEVLNAAYPKGWGDLARWQAKHGGRPGFDPRDIYVAEIGGRLVGCLHTAMLPVHITPELTLFLSLDGDLAVHPDARGRSIPELIYAESQRILYARGIPLRGGYTEPVTWTRFYQPRIGYVSDFDSTRSYRKVLDIGPVKQKLLALFHSAPDEPDPLEGPRLEVAVTGIEPFQLRFGRNRVAVLAAPEAKPALRLEADQRIFGLFTAEGAGARGLLKLWSRGAIRLRGLVTGGPRLALWYLQHGRRLMKGPPARG